MPIYEYRCDSCSHEFETIQKLSESPLTRCPACAEEKLRKKVSAAGFRLKGGGWYETDFKGGSKKNVAGEAGAGGDKTKGDSASTGGEAATPAKSSDGASGKGEASKSGSDAKSTPSKPQASE